MSTTYKASEVLKQYIMNKEGCAKWDAARQCYMSYADGGSLSTIGYGHLITHDELEKGLFTNGLTQDSCRILFQSDLQRCESLVNNLNIPNLTQGQFDALVDFCWNCGFKALNVALSYGLEHFPEHCLKYIHDAKGHIEPGLVSRRQDEVYWWDGATPEAA
jgi:GH24 family phage-related lysozyme (muramidase)